MSIQDVKRTRLRVQDEQRASASTRAHRPRPGPAYDSITEALCPVPQGATAHGASPLVRAGDADWDHWKNRKTGCGWELACLWFGLSPVQLRVEGAQALLRDYADTLSRPIDLLAWLLTPPAPEPPDPPKVQLAQLLMELEFTICRKRLGLDPSESNRPALERTVHIDRFMRLARDQRWAKTTPRDAFDKLAVSARIRVRAVDRDLTHLHQRLPDACVLTLPYANQVVDAVQTAVNHFDTLYTVDGRSRPTKEEIATLLGRDSKEVLVSVVAKILSPRNPPQGPRTGRAQSTTPPAMGRRCKPMRQGR